LWEPPAGGPTQGGLQAGDGSTPACGTPAVVLGLSGVMCLGLGDTAASAVGYLLGRHPIFPGSSKTWEGTSAGFAATMAGWLVLAAVGGLQLQAAQWAWLAACTAAASLLEAATWQLDNLFVPLYYASAILGTLYAAHAAGCQGGPGALPGRS
jgi:dolichol kinase